VWEKPVKQVSVSRGDQDTAVAQRQVAQLSWMVFGNTLSHVDKLPGVPYLVVV
jgi:hypothetical protein